MNKKVQTSTVCLCLALLIFGGIGALRCREYLQTHRTYVSLNLFLVRDVNGNLARNNFEFYVKGHKQRCSSGLYWP